jgi:hypothetical protein
LTLGFRNAGQHAPGRILFGIQIHRFQRVPGEVKLVAAIIDQEVWKQSDSVGYESRILAKDAHTERVERSHHEAVG